LIRDPKSFDLTVSGLSLSAAAQSAARASLGFTCKLRVMVVALIVSIASPSAFNFWQNHYSKEANVKARVQKNRQWILDRYKKLKPEQKKTAQELGVFCVQLYGYQDSRHAAGCDKCR
jgi:Tfp pilus assembly protein PilE